MSKRDVQFSLLLVFAAVLTLGIKVSTTNYDLAIDSPALTRAIQAKLDQQGFATTYIAGHYQSDMIDAVRGPCRLRIRDGTMASQFAVIFAAQAKGFGPLRYVDKGTWRDEAPVLRMGVELAGAHVLNRLGFPARFQPVLAVAARGCDPATIDLTGIWQAWTRTSQLIPRPRPSTRAGLLRHAALHRRSAA